MVAYAPTVPTRAGVLSSGVAVTATDTIPLSAIGPLGSILEITNAGGSPDAMTISDASVTRSGAAAAALAPTVTNATARAFVITPDMADPTTGNISITHSFITTVTYKLWPRTP